VNAFFPPLVSAPGVTLSHENYLQISFIEIWKMAKAYSRN